MERRIVRRPFIESEENNVVPNLRIEKATIGKPRNGIAVPFPAARRALGDVSNKQPPAQRVVLLKKPSTTSIYAPIRNYNPSRPAAKTTTTTITTQKQAVNKNVKKEATKEAVNRVVKQPALANVHKQQIAQLKGTYDVDTDTDPQLVCEYIKDITKYLIELETQHPIRKDFMMDHASTLTMRRIVINWMAGVCHKYKFVIETFHLSVYLMDRFLQENKRIGKEKLQLVGTVGMFIASKYEEVNVVCADDFILMCDNAFKAEEIFRMELDMLKCIDYAMGRPTAISFLRRFNKLMKTSRKEYYLSKYIVDLALMEYDLCHIAPSIHAAAACCLSKFLFADETYELANGWSELLVDQTNYKFEELKDMVFKLATMLSKADSARYQQIREIYEERNNMCISSHGVLKKGGKLAQFHYKTKAH